MTAPDGAGDPRKGVRAWSIFGLEAWNELRAGLRGPMVPLMFMGLVAYVFLMLASADNLRQMGAADVPRNSALIVYQMTSGQAFWLIFVWAWVFAQVVARDRSARLQEVVLATPVSMKGLFLSRYVGALGLALILGSSSSLALLLVPLMAKIGVFPEGTIGPTPFAAIAHAWLLFVVPSALGLGALYVTAAFWTRSVSGPFAASAVVIFLWMTAMVMLRSADVHLEFATLIDASGFGEAEHQSKLWTPAQKRASLLEITPALAWNRALWTLVPLAIFGLVLSRLPRESLVLERAKKNERRKPSTRFASEPRSLGPVTAPSWILATCSDAIWQFRHQVLGWPFLIAMALWFMLNSAAPFAHMMAHAEGPLVPRGHLLAPFLLDLSYVFSVFGTAGFIGVLVRRDGQSGFAEVIDAARAPLSVRVLATAFAAIAVTLVFTLVPALSAWVVMALQVPGGFDFWSPVLVSGLMATPALLELGAITFAVHSLLRSAGTAHALSMFAALVAIVNHEVNLVTYPPAQVGITAHVPLSEIQSFGPWLSAVLTLDVYKVAGAALLVAFAWIVFPRGTALTVGERWRVAGRRFAGPAGMLASAALLCCVGLGWLLHDRLVTRGHYLSALEEDAEDAAWEKRFWGRPAPFTLQGGHVDVLLDAHSQRARSKVRLTGIQCAQGRLTGQLPQGTRSIAATANGRSRDVSVAFDHFELDLGDCRARRCDLEMELEIAADGWRLQKSAPHWLHRTGIWARAEDVVPRLGLDPDRLLRSPTDRLAHALSPSLAFPGRFALVSARGVLPAGRHSWRVRIIQPGRHTALEGKTDGPLDFAVAWYPDDTRVDVLKHQSVIAWHGPASRLVAGEILSDLAAMQRCVQERTGFRPHVAEVLQAPRDLGEVALHGSILWLPEEKGWDVAARGVGRSKRRAAIGEALAAAAIARAADLRLEPGSRFLTSGVAGYVGLACLLEQEGSNAWLTWLARRSEHVAEELGALDAPIVGLAEDGPAPWVSEYAPLATLAWARTQGEREFRSTIQTLVARVGKGASIRAAVEQTLNHEVATLLLGAPHSADVSLVEATDGVEVRSERQRWDDGGWQPGSSGASVTVHDEEGGTRTEKLPQRLDPNAPVTVFLAEPSYERAPLDNRWPRPGR